MKFHNNALIIGSYIVGISGLFLYSFTQIDLGLTLMRMSVWQGIQKAFQYIGYFDRPLSTQLYIVIVSILFITYLALLSRIATKGIARATIWKMIFFTTILLTFAYNAFSYDLFNYIFDARIITKYGEDPYLHKALDYPGDPMLGFMRWTHRTYPYGPVWLWMSVPLSYLGMHYLLPTLILFKLLMSVSFVGTAYYIEKILQKLSPDHALFGLAFFAFNPLVVIESLVSSHHDIVMMFLTMLALYLLIEKKYVRSMLSLVLSIGIKFATIFLLPVYGLIMLQQWKKKQINWDMYIGSSAFLMIGAVIAASVRTNFQPWYLMFIFPFAALVAKKYYVCIPMIIMSLFSLLMYTPYLYHGNWNPPIPTLLNTILYTGIGVSVLLTVARYSIVHIAKRK